MRKIPRPVGYAGSLIFLGLLLAVLVRSDEVDLHRVLLLPAVGAIILGAGVLVFYSLGWRRR